MHLEYCKASRFQVPGFETMWLKKRNTCSVRTGQCLVTATSAENRSILKECLKRGINRCILKAHPSKSWSEQVCQCEQTSCNMSRKEVIQKRWRGNVLLGWHSIFVKPHWSYRPLLKGRLRSNFVIIPVCVTSVTFAGKLYLHVRWEFGVFLEFRNYGLQLFPKLELDENAVVAEFRTLKSKIPRYKIGLGTGYLSIFSTFCRK